MVKHRYVFDIRGVIQGVGLRPAVFRLAQQAGFTGWVQNRAGSVRILVEGARPELERFMQSLPDKLPSHAHVETAVPIRDEPVDETDCHPDFSIKTSHVSDRPEIMIPADLAMCPDCRREVLDPHDRRYGYPFTTCTACGPRYTVVNGMPYDRERTTLNRFPLCDACRREYNDPADRRFHAESTACPDCGPRLSFAAADPAADAPSETPLRATRRALAAGRIVAVRGIGGFLLAADAFSRPALQTLRRRKHRPHKPFAVMARDLETVRRFCRVPPEAADLLRSPLGPIVILDVRPDPTAGRNLPIDLLTPDSMTLGVMLPTAPLHLLLFEPLADDPAPAFDWLLMTSGNRAGEPICITNDEAKQRLSGIADAFCFHDREINLRNDDSVCVIRDGAPQVWRRARGYAPHPIGLSEPLRHATLAMGAEIKNAPALGYGSRVVPAPHVGDLETPEACDGLERVAECLPRFLQVQPERIAVDRHPDMFSTQLGRRIASARRLPVVPVQHHHAHAAACLAEHGRREGLALVLDGTGLGPDGSIWGAELLEITTSGYRRLATFTPVPLPGGDAAVRRPVRQLLARWYAAGLEPDEDALRELGVTAADAAVWRQQIARGLNCPMTHAAGRLFDAFSAALGTAPATMTYEGQAPIRLEAAAWACHATDLPDVPFRTHVHDNVLRVDWAPAFIRLYEQRPRADAASRWAKAVHRAIAKACMEMIGYAFDLSPFRTVALSGGVFMNRILTQQLADGLRQAGSRVLLHRLTPPNDGCVAFGQAVVAGYGEEMEITSCV